MYNYKKKIIIFLITFICLIFITSCNSNNKYLRLRIIANSNNEADQFEKEYVKNIIKNIYNKYNMLDYNKLNDQINEFNDGTLKNNIKVELKNETFEAKSLNGEFIPSGNYAAIVITIGEGLGDNFWTLLYPDYFNINFESNNEITYKSFFFDKFFK